MRIYLPEEITMLNPEHDNNSIY